MVGAVMKAELRRHLEEVHHKKANECKLFCSFLITNLCDYSLEDDFLMKDRYYSTFYD